jgi:hypothetical protein
MSSKALREALANLVKALTPHKEEPGKMWPHVEGALAIARAALALAPPVASPVAWREIICRAIDECDPRLVKDGIHHDYCLRAQKNERDLQESLARAALRASPPPQAPVGSPQPCVCCGTFDTPRRDGYCPDCYPHPPKPDVTYWFVEAYRDGEATGVWLGRDGRSVTRDPLEAMRFTDKTKAQDSAIACVGTPLFDLARWYASRKAKTMSKEPPCLKVCCDRNGTGLKLIEIARAIEKRMEVPTKAIREDHPTAQAANAELFAYWWVLFAMERISGIPVRTTPTTDPEQSGPLNVSGPVAWREPHGWLLPSGAFIPHAPGVTHAGTWEGCIPLFTAPPESGVREALLKDAAEHMELSHNCGFCSAHSDRIWATLSPVAPVGESPRSGDIASPALGHDAPEREAVTPTLPTEGPSGLPRCPLCDGSHWRMLSDGIHQCMTCGEWTGNINALRAQRTAPPPKDGSPRPQPSGSQSPPQSLQRCGGSGKIECNRDGNVSEIKPCPGCDECGGDDA